MKKRDKQVLARIDKQMTEGWSLHQYIRAGDWVMVEGMAEAVFERKDRAGHDVLLAVALLDSPPTVEVYERAGTFWVVGV